MIQTCTSTRIYGRDKYKYRWQRQVQQQQSCTSSNIWSEIPLEVVHWSGWDEIVLMVRRMATTLAVWSRSCQQKDIWRFPRLWRSSPGLFCVMAYKDHNPHLGTITYGEHRERGCRQSNCLIMVMLYRDIPLYIWHGQLVKISNVPRQKWIFLLLKATNSKYARCTRCTGQKLAELAGKMVCFVDFPFPNTMVRHLDMMTSKMVMMMLNIEEDRQRVLSWWSISTPCFHH